MIVAVMSSILGISANIEREVSNLFFNNDEAHNFAKIRTATIKNKKNEIKRILNLVQKYRS